MWADRGQVSSLLPMAEPLESFEDLGLQPALVEALAQEGLERPTALQRSLIPVLRRGSSAAVEAGPGSGLFVAFGAPLLDRLPAGASEPSALILTASRERAGELAVSLARLALATGHRVGALGVPWSRPTVSDIVFATPRDADQAVRSASLKLDGLQTLVLDGAGILLEGGDGASAVGILEGAAEPPQVVVVAEKLTPAVRRWVDEHARRAVFVPPEAARGEEPPAAPTTRGTIRVHVSADDPETVVPGLVQRLLLEGEGHVIVYARSIDDAADLGDAVGLQGFGVGRPGDSASPIWLGVDPLESREMIATSEDTPVLSAVISADTPTDADELDRRHGGGHPRNVIIAPPRAVPHLRRIAREAGYLLEPDLPIGLLETDEPARFRASVEAAIEEEDLAPYLLLLEPIMRSKSAAEVAAALAAMLRKKTAARVDATGAVPAAAVGTPVRPPAWSRIFLSVGLRDGIGAGDLLGAILGEAKIDREQVGRIDLKDTFSRVEVHDSVAETVIRSLNGTSIRGRSIRADFDRGEGRSSGPSRDRAKSSGRRDRGVPRRGPGPGRPK